MNALGCVVSRQKRAGAREPQRITSPDVVCCLLPQIVLHICLDPMDRFKGLLLLGVQNDCHFALHRDAMQTASKDCTNENSSPITVVDYGVCFV